MVNMSGVGPESTPVPCPTYVINLSFPDHGVRISGLQVAAVPQVPNADFLIGMDIITLGDMAISNCNGDTFFSFRYPSQEKIDFTAPVF